MWNDSGLSFGGSVGYCAPRENFCLYASYATQAVTEYNTQISLLQLCTCVL